MGKLIRILKYLTMFFCSYILAAIVYLFNPKKRNIWLISERGDDARDNGYFFYKYLKSAHPDIPSYYVIKASSADADKILPESRIEPGSFKHFLYFALCKVRISSHAFGGDIPAADYYRKFGFYKRSKKKSVFLQHGITKDYQPNFCYPKFKPDIFVCGAEPEYNYIKESFGHPGGAVLYTGFARFDSLNDFTPKNQILIMPTFRKWLQNENDEDFLKSEFYAKWQTVLNDTKITKLLEEQNIDLIFYPHYVIQKYAHCFSSISNRVKIADFNSFDVQTLLKESKLLITDFSSVFFDFSYMKKPVIFYQFDRARYIKDHYDFTKGYFDYDTMAPGKVAFSEDELISETVAAIKTGFTLKKEYENRRNSFFTKRDQHNCDRIFEAILNL